MTKIGTAGHRAELTGQLSFDGMPVDVFPCTPARLATFEACPRRYRLTYLEEKAPVTRAWGHLSLGASIHLGLARWWSLPLPDRTAGAGADLVRTAWIDRGYRDAAHSVSVRERAAGWVFGYLSTVDPRAEPLGVERTVALQTATMNLSGRVDRVDRRITPDGKRYLVVVDYKTGRRPPTRDDARRSSQLALYAVAAQQMWRLPCTQVELHHLPSGTVAAAEHDAGSLAQQVQHAEALAAQCARATGLGTEVEMFPARTSSGCAFCEVRDRCAPGQAAVAAAPSWALVPE